MNIRDLSFTIIKERKSSLLKGWGVSLFAVLLFVSVVFTLFYLEDYSKYSVAIKSNSQLIFFLVIVPVFFLSKKLLNTGKKIRAKDAISVLEKDSRRPILFLRSFIDDSEYDMSLQMPVRFEETLIKPLRKIGPVIAIGKPNEKLPEIGAARLYVANKDWQAAVEYFMQSSAFIVIMVGSSGGIWWEIETALKIVNPEKLHFFFPYTMSSQTSWLVMQLNSKFRNNKARAKKWLKTEITGMPTLEAGYRQLSAHHYLSRWGIMSLSSLIETGIQNLQAISSCRGQSRWKMGQIYICKGKVQPTIKVIRALIEELKVGKG